MRDKTVKWEIEKRGPVRITLRAEGWFVSAVGKKRPGEFVTLTILRGEAHIELTIKLGKR